MKLRAEVILAFTFVASLAYAGDPPATPLSKKQLPELRFSGAQVRASPALKNEAVKATFDKIKGSALPPIAPEHTRVLSAQLDGPAATCNGKVSFRVRLLGGTRPGPQTVILARITAGGFVPQFDQRSVEVSPGAGEERDVVLVTDWLLKCTSTNNGLFTEQHPEPFFLAVVPESIGANAVALAQPTQFALLYPGAVSSWSYQYHPDVDLRRLLGG